MNIVRELSRELFFYNNINRFGKEVPIVPMIPNADILDEKRGFMSQKQNLKIIYKPSGKAKEYANLAINLYKACTHGCRYCFGAKTPWVLL